MSDLQSVWCDVNISGKLLLLLSQQTNFDEFYKNHLQEFFEEELEEINVEKENIMFRIFFDMTNLQPPAAEELAEMENEIRIEETGSNDEEKATSSIETTKRKKRSSRKSSAKTNETITETLNNLLLQWKDTSPSSSQVLKGITAKITAENIKVAVEQRQRKQMSQVSVRYIKYTPSIIPNNLHLSNNNEEDKEDDFQRSQPSPKKGKKRGFDYNMSSSDDEQEESVNRVVKKARISIDKTPSKHSYSLTSPSQSINGPGGKRRSSSSSSPSSSGGIVSDDIINQFYLDHPGKIDGSIENKYVKEVYSGKWSNIKHFVPSESENFAEVQAKRKKKSVLTHKDGQIVIDMDDDDQELSNLTAIELMAAISVFASIFTLFYPDRYDEVIQFNAQVSTLAVRWNVKIAETYANRILTDRRYHGGGTSKDRKKLSDYDERLVTNLKHQIPRLAGMQSNSNYSSNTASRRSSNQALPIATNKNNNRNSNNGSSFRGAIDCLEWLNTGICTYAQKNARGLQCRYKHDESKKGTSKGSSSGVANNSKAVAGVSTAGVREEQKQ